jgi:lipopolysaccharide transport system ATP-binding protein
MSAILRLTRETIVLEKGRMVLRAPSAEAVDYYLTVGHAHAGERTWDENEIPAAAAPFRPVGLRLRDSRGKVVNTIRSTESFVVEMEYILDASITGLRVGFFMNTTRGEAVFTSFDTDDPILFEKHTSRLPGHYVSRCTFPADFLNAGRYSMGINASSYHVRRYFEDEQALDFNVDATGAPGMQWLEQRQGPLRPRLDWRIESK